MKPNGYKHGHRSGFNNRPTTEYQIWAGILKRCLNPKCNIYSYYGGRGIKVDPSWKEFSVFLQDVGFRPGKNYSIDRIDNSLGYTKSNVRWATKAEQSRNKSNNIYVEGLVLKDWCNIRGFNYKTVWRWYCREDKTIEFIEETGAKLWVREN